MSLVAPVQPHGLKCARLKSRLRYWLACVVAIYCYSSFRILGRKWEGSRS
jgi:hypothetical protein